MKFVCSLSFSPTNHLCALARTADETGFAYVSLSDHVLHPEKVETPYPYTPDGALRWPPFTHWPDVWVSIGAMAAVTERVRFVTGVYVLPMRNPFLVAKAVATAAVLANDRVSLGIGAGWMKEEFWLLEQAFAGRGRRMDEMVAVLRKLWTGGMVEHHSEFYEFDRLEMSPTPGRPIPIYVGGLSERALKRAARLGDGWISDIHSTEELRAIVAKLRRYRSEAGRGDEPLAILAACNDAFDLDGYHRLSDMGITHLLTRPWVFYGASMEDLDAKRDGMRRFADDVLQKLA